MIEAITQSSLLVLPWHNNVSKASISLDTVYAAYTSQCHDQQHFTMSEVAADWLEIPWAINADNV